MDFYQVTAKLMLNLERLLSSLLSFVKTTSAKYYVAYRNLVISFQLSQTIMQMCTKFFVDESNSCHFVGTFTKGKVTK